jgi:hypothetical protein
MSNDAEQTLFSKKGVVLNLVLSVFFFLFMREVLVPHVPSQDPTAVMIVSSMTSFCMTWRLLDSSQYASRYMG